MLCYTTQGNIKEGNILPLDFSNSHSIDPYVPQLFSIRVLVDFNNTNGIRVLAELEIRVYPVCDSTSLHVLIYELE